MNGRADDPLLQHRHFLRGHLDAEISTRDHDTIRQLADFLQPVDCLRFFQLDDDRCLIADQLARLGNVFRTLHERKGDPIDAKTQREGQVCPVLRAEGRKPEHHTRDIDALVVGKRPAGNNFGLSEPVAAFGHSEPDLAVVEQQVSALMDRVENFGMRHTNALVVARRPVKIETKLRPCFQFDLALQEPRYGALTLQVRHDCD